MVNIRLVLLSSALAAVSAHTRGATLNQDEANLASTVRHNAAHARRLMMDYPKNLAEAPKEDKEQEKEDEKASKGAGKGQTAAEGNSDETVVSPTEEFDCVPWDTSMQALAASSLTDDECRNNECSGGCCRLYDWLICDDKDEMPTLPCVCNENTRKPVEDATAVEASPTDPPIDPPTDAPVSPPEDSPFVASSTSGDEEPEQIPVVSKRDFGGAPAESCEGGSAHHNNPLFADFQKCFSASDCPQATDCCIHSFCFCGEPDDWTADCVEATVE